jgi:hypothetical protein
MKPITFFNDGVGGLDLAGNYEKAKLKAPKK